MFESEHLNNLRQNNLDVDSNLLKLLNKNQEFSMLFATACYVSDYFSKQVFDNLSDWFIEQYLTGQLEIPSNQVDYKKLLSNHLVNCNSIDDLMDRLRLFRHQSMVKIIWRNACGLSDFQEEVQALSNLADSCIQQALDIIQAKLVQHLKQPMNARNIPMSLIVIAMGKLGGQELNLSSDVDLIFTFETDDVYPDKQKYFYSDYFNAVAKLLIRALSEETINGFVFRVDMRLRPYGDSGPLVVSFTALEAYYESQGRAWERYAMIKARLITGSSSEQQKLRDLIKPFVYRKYLDYSVLDEIREIKKSIHKELSGVAEKNNIKLGNGGIREIEFIVQAFQLIYGGKKADLQISNILAAKKQLVNFKMLKPAIAKTLESAYLFLRKLEHRLQMLNDKQTHSLPDSPITQKIIAFGMDFKDWPELIDILNYHTVKVHKHFSDLIVMDSFTKQYSDKDVLQIQQLQAVWSQDLSDEKINVILNISGFQSPEKILNMLKGFQRQFSNSYRSSKARERLDKLMPLLLFKIGHRNEPEILFSRILDIISALNKRSAYLLLLIENPTVLDNVFDLCEYSYDFSKIIKQYPALMDDFLNEETLFSLMTRESLQIELQQIIESIPEEDIEQQMDALRYVKHSHLLRIIACEIKDSLPLMKISDKLTELAEEILQAAMKMVWVHIKNKYQIVKNLKTPNICVLAYGKLAGLEMNYNSDLDLVFIYDVEKNNHHELHEIYNRFVQRLIHFLSTTTAQGNLYQIDARLRPTGESGLLACTVDFFAEYQNTKAWVWEHQALVRSRVIVGSEKLSDKIYQIRKNVLCKNRDDEQLKLDVLSMRQKMQYLNKSQEDLFNIKYGFGGIVDIEFIVQFLVLQNAYKYPNICFYPDNIRIIESLVFESILSADNGQHLITAYLKLRKIQHICVLQNKKEFALLADVKDIIEPIHVIWRMYIEA